MDKAVEIPSANGAAATGKEKTTSNTKKTKNVSTPRVGEKKNNNGSRKPVAKKPNRIVKSTGRKKYVAKIVAGGEQLSKGGELGQRLKAVLEMTSKIPASKRDQVKAGPSNPTDKSISVSPANSDAGKSSSVTETPTVENMKTSATREELLKRLTGKRTSQDITTSPNVITTAVEKPVSEVSSVVQGKVAAKGQEGVVSNEQSIADNSLDEQADELPQDVDELVALLKSWGAPKEVVEIAIGKIIIL